MSRSCVGATPPTVRVLQLESRAIHDVKTAAIELLEYCARGEATPTDAVLDRLKEPCRVDNSVLTQAGFGAAAMSLRRSGARGGGKGAMRQHIFVVSLRPGDTVGPVRLRD